MSSDRFPVTLVEIDLDYCDNTYGSAPCTAALGFHPRKCYQGFFGCQDTANFVSGVKTLKFCEKVSNFPPGLGYIPCVLKVSEYTATVNIAGSDPRLSALGKRGEVTIDLEDFPFDDIGMDKYVNERISGAAQNDEAGYQPIDRGTYFRKLNIRHPYVYGRAMRVIRGYIENGAIVDTTTRNHIVLEVGVTDENNIAQVIGRDEFDLATNDKAVLPPVNTGVLAANLTAVATSATLSPAGIGAEYAASGRMVIGSEVMDYTRSGDVLTLTRGTRGTVAAAHNLGDTVQRTFSLTNSRIDDALGAILSPFLPAASLPKAAKWAPEVDRWAPSVRVTTDVTRVEGAAKLAAELANLGVTIWWDDVLKEVLLKMNRPPDTDTVVKITDSQIIRIRPETRPDDRLSRIYFRYYQQDPTKSLDTASNYNIVQVVTDATLELSTKYGVPKIRQINSRWFNNGGAEGDISILARRLLNRFVNPPTLYHITLDASLSGIGLADVIEVTSWHITDDTGKATPQLLQVISKSELIAGHQFTITAQIYSFRTDYGYITENTRPVYSSSSAAQKAQGAYLVDGTTLQFADGRGPYRMI